MKRRLVILRKEKQNCTTTIEMQQWLPAASLAVFLFWYIATPTRIAAMGAATIAGILIMAFIWARAMANLVDGRRQLRSTALQVGDELEEDIHLWNQSALPVLWAEFVDRSSIPGYQVTSVRASDPESAIHWRAHTICPRRGVYILGPWELLMGDPFGIFLVRKLYHHRQEILVYPPLANLPPHLLPHSGVQGEQRPLHQPIQAETINATTARPFIPGDPLRHIHWRTTARKDSPFVKQFEPEAATSIWLVPDCDALVQLGQGDRSTFETMILVMASLAVEMLHDQLSVGFYASAKEETIILPQRGQPHLWTILQALAPLEPAVEHPLSLSLQRVRQLITARTMLVILTPSLHGTWLPSARQLNGLRSMGRVEVILLDPASFGGVGHAENFLPLLAEAGITGRIIQQGQVRPIAASYGELSRWEFKNLATGRVVARHTPRQANQGPSASGGWKWREPE